jgi:hypothetical protein
MREVTYTSTRIVLTAEEKRIAKAWKGQWKRILEFHRDGGKIPLIIGTWSGYTANQRRDVHCSLGSKSIPPNKVLGMVKFSDRTTMTASQKEFTLQEILEKGILPMSSYQDAVTLMKKGETIVDWS